MIGRSNKKLWSVSLGAGVLGALAIAVRYALRPPQRELMPDAISPAIFATRMFSSSVGDLLYHESGSGEPLIFIHGISIGASSYEWSKVYPTFAGDYRVLAPDLLGYGESSRPNRTLTEMDYVRSLAEFCRGLCHGERPIIVGSGLGGGFCALLASQHPELVDRLVLLMPTGLGDFGRQRLPLTTTLLSKMPILNRFVYRNYFSTPAAVRTWLTQYGFADPALVTDELVRVYTTCAQQYGAQHAVLNFHSGRLNFDLERRMRDLNLPVTLLWSEQATFPPLEWAYRLQEAAPRCSLYTLQNVGPLAALEDPPQVTEVLREALNGQIRLF